MRVCVQSFTRGSQREPLRTDFRPTFPLQCRSYPYHWMSFPERRSQQIMDWQATLESYPLDFYTLQAYTSIVVHTTSKLAAMRIF